MRSLPTEHLVDRRVCDLTRRLGFAWFAHSRSRASRQLHCDSGSLPGCAFEAQRPAEERDSLADANQSQPRPEIRNIRRGVEPDAIVFYGHEYGMDQAL